MTNLSPRALLLSQAHGPGPVDWERVAVIVDGRIAAENAELRAALETIARLGVNMRADFSRSADQSRIAREALA